jgi:hypothetical protein
MGVDLFAYLDKFDAIVRDLERAGAHLVAGPTSLSLEYKKAIVASVPFRDEAGCTRTPLETVEALNKAFADVLLCEGAGVAS